jgi:hypothetical protein
MLATSRMGRRVCRSRCATSLRTSPCIDENDSPDALRLRLTVRRSTPMPRATLSARQRPLDSETRMSSRTFSAADVLRCSIIDSR